MAKVAKCPASITADLTYGGNAFGQSVRWGQAQVWTY